MASASPRRRELLERLGIPFEILASHIPEEHPALPPAQAIAAVALAKARAVAAGLDRAPAVVLGADTEVVLDGRLLGKPRDPADAARMLRELRGREHEVITGLALVELDAPGAPSRQETTSVTSRVRMGDYGDAAIEAYVATGEPLDKAGAYAVQGLGGQLVASVVGCFTNVVGLPLTTTRALLERRGLRAS
ncbi:MAG TPA: Maf family protein [Methylomirabilota bacterium]|nr:Maf family protein [Methylomirabilota bacterium]